MRYLAITMIAMTVFFAGCARHNPKYIANDQTVRPMKVPTNTKIKQGQNYYPVPNGTSSVNQSPSLVPPGSNLQRFKNQSQKRISNKKLVSLQQKSDGPLILVISEKANQAWAQIGRALQKTPYQVLDQDDSLRSYYVLDVKSTNNRITKKTPIYRVYLKPKGNQTQVVLMDKDNQPAAKNVTQRILTAIQRRFT